MKITVTHDAGPVDTLTALHELVERASQLVTAAGPGHDAPVAVKVNITPTRKLRSLEVSW